MRKVPEGWAWTTLGKICSKPQYGWTTKGIEHGRIKLLRTTDITKGVIDWSSVPFCAQDPPARSKYQLAEDDIVISRAGSVGVSALLQQPIPAAVFASYLIRFKALGILPRFTAYYLQSPRYWAAISENAAGIAIPNVNATKLAALRIPLAPFREQHRIVAKIESLFAKLDEGVAALKRAEANLERYRASVLKAAVEGRLTEQWRRENPPEETAEELLQRILAVRRKCWEEEQLARFEAKGKKLLKNWKAKYKEPVKPDTSGLPGLPEGWCWATVDQVTAGNRTSAYGVLKPGPEVLGGIPLVRVGNIQNGMVSGPLKRIAPEVASRYGRTRLRGGELLITLVGAIGRTAVVPSDLSGANTARAVGVVPVSPMLDPRWTELWFRSPLQRLQMIGKAHEVARKTLNLEDVRSATVALAPGCEQRAILLAVEETERGLTPTVEHMKESRSYAATLRQSILKRAFEGRLVPQDPADEPASVLLEGIRAEREAERRRRKRHPAKPRRQLKTRVS